MAKKNTRNTRASIVDAAWQLFYEQGYEDTTVEEIIAASHTSKGSFYHYFGGKDALLATLSDLFDQKYQDLQPTLDPAMPALDKLLFLNRALFQMIEDRVPLDLLARLLSTQLVTTGARHLLDHRRTYYRLLRQMADAGCRYGVMEVSSHALALERVRGINFRVGAFTNLTRDHLDFHRTMEDYCDAKAQLFRQCEAAVCNGDDPWTPRLLRECACPVLRYGTGDSSRLRGENLRLTARSVAFDALLDGRRIPVTVPIPGRFTVYNALAALGICHMLGVPPEQGAAALQTASGIKGRMEVVPTPGLPCTVLIDYAHTPDALENVLTAVRGFAEGRVVAVFGCGGDRDREKRPQMGRIVSRLADVAVVTSDNPRWEQPEKIIEDILPGLTGPAESVVICDRREAIGWVLKNSRPKDVIVLCGKGHETYQEVCGEKRHMDERELVAAYTNG